jgi:hypothetical protein
VRDHLTSLEEVTSHLSGQRVSALQLVAVVLIVLGIGYAGGLARFGDWNLSEMAPGIVILMVGLVIGLVARARS